MEELAKQTLALDAKVKRLEAQLKAMKSELLDQMLEENITTIKLRNRTVSVVVRNNKDFGPEINAQELELKAEKKRREVLGQFTIASTTTSLRLT